MARVCTHHGSDPPSSTLHTPIGDVDPVNSPTSDTGTPVDPVQRRRQQVSAWSAAAKRGGYVAILVAMVVFVVGAATTFSPVVTSIIVGCIVVSALLLIPAMIFGYGARAAEREELGLPPGH